VSPTGFEPALPP